MKVLFICKANVYRSVIAEAFLKKFNKNINVISRATNNPLNPKDKLPKQVITLLRTKGLNPKINPEHLARKDLLSSDIIICMRNPQKEIALKLAPEISKKIRVWNVTDIYKRIPENKRMPLYKRTIRILEQKVKDLNKELAKPLKN